MNWKEGLKGERDFNCVFWYFKVVNYDYDYNENFEIKIIYCGGEVIVFNNKNKGK